MAVVQKTTRAFTYLTQGTMTPLLRIYSEDRAAKIYMKMYMHKVLHYNIICDCKILESNKCPNIGDCLNSVVHTHNRLLCVCEKG